MFCFTIIKSKKGYARLKDQEKGQSTNKEKGAMVSRYGVKIVNDVFHSSGI